MGALFDFLRKPLAITSVRPEEIDGIRGGELPASEATPARDELSRANAELRRSNAELEQFAYIASHDLQEPLRMITSYLHLLERRYHGQLDEDAEEFIRYAVDGAARMKDLIQDLLRFSRIGTDAADFYTVSGETVLQNALSNLKAALEESGAVVTSDPLPAITADPGLLTQVFQNLIGNAIKFQRDGPTHIHVSSQRQDAHWVFSIRDNGIGIEPRHAERIFRIFERLHGAEAYPGTGVGLAISKKVIERHGGSIWLESEPGAGSTFHFSVPVETVAANRARSAASH